MRVRSVGKTENSVLARFNFCKVVGSTTGSWWSVAGDDTSKFFSTTFVTLVCVEMKSEPKVTLATLLFDDEVVLVPPTTVLSHCKHNNKTIFSHRRHILDFEYNSTITDNEVTVGWSSIALVLETASLLLDAYVSVSSGLTTT